MTEGAWILGQVRESLPPRLQAVWQFGLAIILVVGGGLIYFVDQHVTEDYFRTWGFAMGVYITVIAFQIARVNYALRRRLDALAPDDLKIAKMLPTHILFLAFSTIFSVWLHMAVMVSLYGEQGALHGLFPYFVCFVFLLKVLGLNLVWRFVLVRQEEATRVKV